MASEQGDTVYANLDDVESSESDEDQEGNDEELDDHEEEDLNSPSTSSPTAISALTLKATPAPSITITSATAAVTFTVPAASAVTVAAIPFDPDTERQRLMEIVQKPQVDESRRLFQRLWTDEDEIELLRGFLDFTTSHRGGGNSHHHDTAPFYEQIKSRLQLDFNKNQLVEKLRRLKKKYRNAMVKINSGKEISFKSPHDQATFETSRKIWSDTGKIIGFEDNVLDDEENNNNNCYLSPTPYSNPNFEVKIEDGVERKVGNSGGSNNRSRKRSRSKSGRMEEEKRVVSDGFVANTTHNENVGSGGGGGGGGGSGIGGGGGDSGNLAGVIEETLKSCLSPLLKEVMNGTAPAAAAMMMGGTPYCGGQGMGPWAPVVVPPSLLPPQTPLLPPFGFGGVVGLGSGCGGTGAGGLREVVNEKWRKQQILELEVYSRRLELLQDQIKMALGELRSMAGGGGGG